MKKGIAFIMATCAGTVVYFFIKEQLHGETLSKKENTALSIVYLLVGVCIIIFARIKYLEKKNEV